MYSVILLLIVLCSLPVLHAQEPMFKCKQLTRADGLSDNHIWCALQDRYGFMWFGSHHGLNRYDGYHITVYPHKPGDTTSLSDITVTCLYEDHEGVLWIGTLDGGINSFDRATERFTQYRHDPRNSRSLSAGKVASMCEDADGTLWVVCEKGTVGKLQKFDRRTRQWIHYSYSSDDPYSIGSTSVRCVCRDSSGTLWVGTKDRGLNRYDKTRDGFINYRTNPGYGYETTGEILRLLPEKAGGFWSSNHTVQLYRLYARGNGFVRRTFVPPGITNNDDNGVTSVMKDNSGNTWVSTLGNAIYILSADEKTINVVRQVPHNSYGLGSKRVFALYQDQYQDIWICTDVGVYKFFRRTYFVQHFQHDPLDATTLSASEVRSIFRDNDDALWVGTAGGGLQRSSGAAGFRHIRVDNDPGHLAENTINILYPGGNGNLLVGSNKGLLTFDTTTSTFKKVPYKINPSRIWSILEDRDSMLWVGTYGGGLTKIDRRRGKVEYFLRELPGRDGGLWPSVFSLYDDGRILWVGTNIGLCKLDKYTGKTSFYQYREGDTTSLSYNHVWSIHRARDGKFWIGTSSGGLNLFDPTTGRFTAFTVEQGLPNNIICGILEDRHGALWISTNDGLAKFIPSTGECIAFNENDGIFLSTFHFKTCFQDSRGMMYFGGMNGFISFHPDSINFPPRRAPLVFTGFRVFDKAVTFDSSIVVKRHVTLDHNSNFFVAEFITLDFSNPARRLYRYMLEGVDRQWRLTEGTHPLAGYTDVPPGEYALRIESSGDGGRNYDSAATLRITVLPAWWQTLWFQGLVVCAVVLIGAFVLWRSLRTIRQRGVMERRLVEFQLQVLRAQINPHFIFNSLNSIYYFIISRNDELAETYLCKFSLLLRSILDSSQKTFISIAEEAGILEMYLELEAMRFPNQFRYEIHIDPEIDAPHCSIPAMLLQPYVENAVKHGLLPKGGNCSLIIDVRRDDKGIICTITDNGVGIRREAEKITAGSFQHISRGMTLSRQRLENLNALYGDLYGVDVQDITDAVGDAAGTRVVLRLPNSADIG